MKLPPIEKVPEAFSAIADGRVIMNENTAQITSSSGEKIYTVVLEGDTYASNDSATYWQGYPGYPIIAVLMLQSRLNFNEDSLYYFKDINWTLLNKKHKRDYTAALAEVFRAINIGEEKTALLQKEIAHIYESLISLDLEIKRNTKKPTRMV